MNTDKRILQALGEAFEGSSLEGSSRFWQGRRARGRNRKRPRESGGPDPRFGKATFPLAPPLPRGYTKGGGGVAGVPELVVLEDGAHLEANLTNLERAWLTDHDMPLGTSNRIVVLRRIQEWDAEIAAIAKKLLKSAPVKPSSAGLGQQELSCPSAKRATTSHVWRAKQASRRRE